MRDGLSKLAGHGRSALKTGRRWEVADPATPPPPPSNHCVLTVFGSLGRLIKSQTTQKTT